MPASMPHGAWLGRLERRQLEAFVARIVLGTTVWDIGANVGLYTIPAARAVGPSGLVVAFEPVPRNIHYLRRHVELNRLGQVAIVEAAVAEASRPLEMMPGDSPSEGRLGADGPWIVRGIALDEWRAATGAPAPSLVKIDVEGAEDRVLMGAAATLTEAHPTIFLSLHGDRQREMCYRVLTAREYVISSLMPDRPVAQSSEWLARHV